MRVQGYTCMRNNYNIMFYMFVCACMESCSLSRISLLSVCEYRGEGVGGHITCSSKFQVEKPLVGGTYLMKDFQNLLCHVRCLRVGR